MAGYFLFDWTLQFGVLVLALPGALVGILCGSATRVRSLPAGIMAGVIALVLSIYIEWRFFPFAADKSLAYFLAHLHQASGQTWIMILGGTLAGFWFGLGPIAAKRLRVGGLSGNCELAEFTARRAPSKRSSL